MADDFREGDHWVIDDITGQKIRASEARRQWDGLLVHKDTWSPRQPQDLVRGLVDNMVAEPSRPRPVDTFIGPLVTEIKAHYAFSSAFSSAFQTERIAIKAGLRRIKVASTARMQAGDSISIMLDDGTFLTTIETVDNSKTLTLATALPGPSSDGNRVFINTAMAEPNIG